MNRWVILDRDGVINRDAPDYVKSLAEWQPLPGSIAAIARLSRAGYRVAIATNQSGGGRGLIRSEDLHAMHAELCRQVVRAGGVVDGIFYCPHAPEADCRCRKPRTGLLDAIARRFAIDLRGQPAVGDSLRDLEAARAAGCLPVLVRTGNGRATEMRLAAAALRDLPVYDDLAAVADAFAGPQL
ncbi:MAG: D-glycero-beta-D-manno-heptose 1,7-bisphosphate 7-phosphatase [Pseudomonadales bacterium]|nr:D-glycero-beta-D-manno-heptose 1,7-bisphosphate 7-phosphatase [Pseudomonadales bacterium]